MSEKKSCGYVSLMKNLEVSLGPWDYWSNTFNIWNSRFHMDLAIADQVPLLLLWWCELAKFEFVNFFSGPYKTQYILNCWVSDMNPITNTRSNAEDVLELTWSWATQPDEPDPTRLKKTRSDKCMGRARAKIFNQKPKKTWPNPKIIHEKTGFTQPWPGSGWKLRPDDFFWPDPNPTDDQV